MTSHDIAIGRLQAQGITRHDFGSAYDVVTHMGAMQAQDYNGALWSIGLRMPQATIADIELSIARGEIIRTWPMRGTLHFLPAEDARWMLQLLTPRVMSSAASRDRNLLLTPEIYVRCFDIFRRAMEGGKAVLRSELMVLLETAGISTSAQRGYHILWRAAQEGLICLGPMHGKQPTFVLLEEWAPRQHELGHDEALAEIARRYFRSHGPATEHDFARWTGLSLTEARKGIAANMSDFRVEVVDGVSYLMSRDMQEVSDASSLFLLPGFDEFMLGYKNRGAALHVDHASKIVPGNNGMFISTVVIDGHVQGIWKRVARKHSTSVHLDMFNGEKLSAKHQRLLLEVVRRYGSFLGANTVLS